MFSSPEVPGLDLYPPPRRSHYTQREINPQPRWICVSMWPHILSWTVLAAAILAGKPSRTGTRLLGKSFHSPPSPQSLTISINDHQIRSLKRGVAGCRVGFAGWDVGRMSYFVLKVQCFVLLLHVWNTKHQTPFHLNSVPLTTRYKLAVIRVAEYWTVWKALKSRPYRLYKPVRSIP